MLSFCKKLHNAKEGLTTIELVVVFGIFAALASSVLFSYREFSTNIKLQNLTQDVALQIRQAQTSAVSGTYPALGDGQIGPTTSWTPSYGLYFSMEPEHNKRFVLFFDQNSSAVSNPDLFNPLVTGDRMISDGDLTCNSNPSSECLDIIEITGGEIVQSICFDDFSYQNTNQDSAVCDYSADNVHIVFSRPLNRAYISFDGMNPDTFISDVSIYLESLSGQKSVVRVTATGQIIVE